GPRIARCDGPGARLGGEGMNPSLQGKVVVVTGASRGIGRAIAKTLAARGATVLAGARDQAKLETLLAEIGAAAGEAQALVLDGASATAVAQAFERGLAEHGRVDGLVNNAGIARDGLLLRMKPSDWDAVLATNLTGTFLCTQAALRPMLRQRAGRVVNI